MSSALSLAFAAVGAVAAAAGGGTLLARCFRAPRPDLIAWSIALLGLLVSLGSQLLGYLGGYDAAIFRAMAVGGLGIAPLAAALGLSEIASKGLAARFCARLYLSAVAIVAVVILVLDQLGTAPFTKAWPDPHTYYQSPPNYLLYATSVVTIIVTLIAVGVVMARSRDRDWSRASTPQVGAGIAALMLAYPGLALLVRYEAKQSLPLGSAFTPLLAIAAGLLVWASIELSDQNLAVLHGRAGRSGKRGAGRDSDFSGDSGHYGDDGRHYDDDGRHYDDDSGQYGDRYPERAQHGQYPQDASYEDHPGDRGEYRPERRPDGMAGSEQDRRYGDDYDRGYEAGDDAPGDYAPGDYAADDHAADDHASGDYATGDYASGDYATGDYASGDYASGDYATGDFAVGDFDAIAASATTVPPALAQSGVAPPGLIGPDPRYPLADTDGYPAGAGQSGSPPGQSRQDLFGQIAIYTLLEDRVQEFDLLTGRVVEEVRSREPDTLVFIVHAVPSAPMQRILYEVYRDRTAFEWHRQQPYVAMFESDRRPYVLATNVIELGLQQAKVTPFPSVAELFGEPGYDTSGFERPDYLRDYGRPPARDGDSRPGGRR
jgi:quinol monooxygenase YgiN